MARAYPTVLIVLISLTSRIEKVCSTVQLDQTIVVVVARVGSNPNDYNNYFVTARSCHTDIYVVLVLVCILDGVKDSLASIRVLRLKQFNPRWNSLAFEV
jgi:hypothetical protein